MKALIVSAALVLTAGTLPSAQPQPAPVAAGTDVYHVHFTKAAPGQAAELGKALVVPDPKAAMKDHFVVLRHQEGDDWDYVVIQHLGKTATVTAEPGAPTPGRDLRAWHSDTFVSGPSWTEFAREMGIGGATNAAGAIYTVGVQRAVPGHRDQLLKALSQPAASKVQSGNVMLQHLEGGEWSFLTLTRHNSWQDFATERADAMAAAGSGAGGWSGIRQHSDFHRDTIADRLFPR
jgi:hypothetical protein